MGRQRIRSHAPNPDHHRGELRRLDQVLADSGGVLAVENTLGRDRAEPVPELAGRLRTELGKLLFLADRAVMAGGAGPRLDRQPYRDLVGEEVARGDRMTQLVA